MTTLEDVVKAFLWGQFDKMPLRSTQGKLQAEHLGHSMFVLRSCGHLIATCQRNRKTVIVRYENVRGKRFHQSGGNAIHHFNILVRLAIDDGKTLLVKP